jgi:hypothetical protein
MAARPGSVENRGLLALVERTRGVDGGCMSGDPQGNEKSVAPRGPAESCRGIVSLERVPR